MNTWHKLRDFRTKRFSVALEFQQEDADNTYCFRVVVRLDGRELADTYLGDSIYENPGDFGREHIGHGASCYSDMVREAVGYARRRLNHYPRMRLTVQP